MEEKNSIILLVQLFTYYYAVCRCSRYSRREVRIIWKLRFYIFLWKIVSFVYHKSLFLFFSFRNCISILILNIARVFVTHTHYNVTRKSSRIVALDEFFYFFFLFIFINQRQRRRRFAFTVSVFCLRLRNTMSE